MRERGGIWRRGRRRADCASKHILHPLALSPVQSNRIGAYPGGRRKAVCVEKGREECGGRKDVVVGRIV